MSYSIGPSLSYRPYEYNNGTLLKATGRYNLKYSYDDLTKCLDAVEYFKTKYESNYNRPYPREFVITEYNNGTGGSRILQILI